MTVVLLTGDLMAIAHADGAAARAGRSVRAISSASEAVAYCVAERANLLIVDLSTPSLDVRDLLDQLKTATSTPPRVVAFGPHVHEDRLAAARAAGCDEVVSRGQFFAQLDAILDR